MKVLEYHGVLGGPAGATCQLLLIVGRAPVFDRSQDGQEEQSDKGRKMALPNPMPPGFSPTIALLQRSSSVTSTLNGRRGGR